MVKDPPVNAEDLRDVEFNPWGRKIPWRGKWQPTSVFLPGESHGAWWATVHRVAKSRTRRKRLSTVAQHGERLRTE